MVTKQLFGRLTGIALTTVLVLSACNTATSTVAPAPSLPTPTASLLPVLATATATTALVATETAIPTIVAAATTAATLGPTEQSVAQVIPNFNAYCRKGPGTDYDSVTYLSSGTTYNVIGRNSSNTWWLIEVPGNVTCWTGAPGTSQQGPVNQAPIVLVAPALLTPALFVGSYICDPSTKKLGVTLNWAKVAKATGYRIYRNGVLLDTLGATATAYHDNAPLKMSLVYELQAINDYDASPRVSALIPECG